MEGSSEQGSSSSAEASSSAPQKTCAKCGKAETGTEEGNFILKPCGMCKSVSYCSRDCKKNDLKVHKKVCAAAAQEYSKTADIKMASRQAPKEKHRGGLQKWEFDT